MTPCPNQPQSCQCPEHADGLAAYAPDRDAYDALLDSTSSAPTRLTLVTMPVAEVCHGFAHGCSCSQCTLRAEHHGELPPPTARAPQPWEPRPARHRRAA